MFSAQPCEARPCSLLMYLAVGKYQPHFSKFGLIAPPGVCIDWALVVDDQDEGEFISVLTQAIHRSVYRKERITVSASQYGYMVGMIHECSRFTSWCCMNTSDRQRDIG